MIPLSEKVNFIKKGVIIMKRSTFIYTLVLSLVCFVLCAAPAKKRNRAKVPPAKVTGTVLKVDTKYKEVTLEVAGFSKVYKVKENQLKAFKVKAIVTLTLDRLGNITAIGKGGADDN